MIITSLLDTDLYKFTMGQVVLHKYPSAMVRYRFKCRNKMDLAEHIEEIRSEIRSLCTLRFNREELDFLRTIPFLKPDFIEYLRLLSLNPDYVNVYIDENKELAIEVFGPWISTIWFEVPVLAIVSEVWGKYNNVIQPGMNKLQQKVLFLADAAEAAGPFTFADFGTRRRYSFEWQRNYVVPAMVANFPHHFVGTSNVLIAKELNIKYIGTMAHEFLMAHQQLGFRMADFQKAALQAWADEYRGHLGTALTDTVGMKAFLRDFDLYFAKLFDGCRHDSGDPYDWAYSLIKHLHELNIDPKTKTAVFSDGLDFNKMIGLASAFNDKIRTSFGIGTNLTNDMGMTPPNIVMKMTECNGRPVAKISDSPGKQMCEDEIYLANLRKAHNI
jgi:nicotinate phosphoribosyltransferase